MRVPDPHDTNPLPFHPRTAFLKPLITRSTISIGDYTYYDDPLGPERFEEHCVLYHFDFIGDRLEIGRYCAIAAETRFIMNGANHSMEGFSTFPFAIFGGVWRDNYDVAKLAGVNRGDTIVGNDVWIGTGATIMPGVRIGDGAVIGAKAVVGSDVPPYAVVVGNPARIVRIRFDEATIGRLLRIAWWDWPVDKVTRNIDAISGNDLARLEKPA